MCRFTSSEVEMDSLIAVPRSCRSCLILSSTHSPIRARKRFVNYWKISSLPLRALKNIIQTARPAVNISQSLRREYTTWLQGFRHSFPAFRPIREVLPASPFAIAAEHRGVADGAAAVIALAHEPAEFRIDGDEVVTAVHRQQMRGAVRTDARQREIELVAILRAVGQR